MLLALDIGGTKIALATAERRGDALALGAVRHYPSADCRGGLEELLPAHFGGRPPRLTAVGIGVAGPVLGRVVQLTNLPWGIDADRLERQLGAPVFLLNDLEAHAYALPHLGATELVTLQAGRPRPGNQALIAAGTGLGETLIIHNPRGLPVVSPSEGGHTDFSPPGPAEVELTSFLMDRYQGHVSWERVVSGQFGFRNLFDFLTATGRLAVPPAEVERLHGRQDIGADILAAAAAGVPYAEYILHWFVRLYGAEAGNLALKAMAVDGVYVAGGIAPRILPWLTNGAFCASFAAKGRFGELLQQMPVHVITARDVALRGAMHFAAAQA